MNHQTFILNGIEDKMTEKAIFPLPIVLYPNGITRLRIFEQRYLRMVKQASGDIGFVISVFDKQNPDELSDVGTFVKIIDFDQLGDGTLGIDIQAQSLVTIGQSYQEQDKLHQAQVTPINHWPEHPFGQKIEILANRLAMIFEQNPAATELYKQRHMDNANWVVARWLEILPLNPSLKAMFYNPNSFDQAIDLLSTVVLAQKATDEVQQLG